jgi:probable F420-dependent oxidoreductase
MRVETGLLNPASERYGGDVPPAPTIEDTIAGAKAIEGVGFDGACTPEAGHDPFLPLAIAAEHTSRLELGTNVAVAFPRSPMATALAAWDLQQLSQGRFTLGLGTQVKGHNERRYSTPWTGPAGPRMREYLLCLKAIYKSFASGGRPTPFEGEYYRFDLLTPLFSPGPIDYPAPKLQIACLGPYMSRLGGELCDGIRPHPIGTFRFTREVMRPAVAEGAERAGRKLADVDIVGAPFLAIGANEEEVEAAKQDAKQHIAFYASTRTYHVVLEHHGWQDVGANLHRLSKQAKWPEMFASISDEMLAEFAVIATYDDFVTEFGRRCGGLYDSVLLDLPASGWKDRDALAEIVRGLHAL